ncbi:MAG: glycosyltransferase family 4 protein [Bacteroidota bacterium]|nr:glycosyltransferase family 4 protein [Bacteroidota bacterium]
MKVLMFGWEFPPHITGGLGTACFGLTQGLSKAGVEVLFVVPKAYGDEDEQAVKLVSASNIKLNIKEAGFGKHWEKVTFIEVGSSLIPYVGPEDFAKVMELSKMRKLSQTSSVFQESFEFSGKYGTNLIDEVSRYALVGASLAEKMNFDVIHAHDWLTYPAGIAAKEISGKPLVVHMHATEFDRSGENVNPQVFDIEKNGMEAADRVITVSNFTRKIVIDRYGIDPEKVFTVHNAVEHVIKPELSEVDRNVDEKVVTFLGRITYQKGPEYFIEAANKVLKRDPNVRFVMAGTGDMMHKMIRRVARLGISTRFHFTGFLKGDDVDRMYALSDVYVMPSVSEPFGISPLEAVRSNVPVIISRQSGVSEVLTHAIKINFWDVDALADAIYGLLHYPAMNKMIEKHGPEELKEMKWDRAALLVKDIYLQVVK